MLSVLWRRNHNFILIKELSAEIPFQSIFLQSDEVKREREYLSNQARD